MQAIRLTGVGHDAEFCLTDQPGLLLCCEWLSTGIPQSFAACMIPLSTILGGKIYFQRSVALHYLLLWDGGIL